MTARATTLLLFASALVLSTVAVLPSARATSYGCSAHGDPGLSPLTHPVSCTFTLPCSEPDSCGWYVDIYVDSQDLQSVHGEVEPSGVGCRSVTANCHGAGSYVQSGDSSITVTCGAGGTGGRLTVSCSFWDGLTDEDSICSLVKAVGPSTSLVVSGEGRLPAKKALGVDAALARLKVVCLP